MHVVNAFSSAGAIGVPLAACVLSGIVLCGAWLHERNRQRP
jgi:hypothetical protein